MLKYPMLLEQRIVFDAAPGADRSGEAVAADPVRVLLVDNQVENAQALAAAAQDGVLVLEFDSRNDTLADVESLVRDAVGDRSVASIGFAGHGEQGGFSLGSDGFVDLSSITDNPDLIAFFEAIGGLLTEDGRIDLLGCDIASGEVGAELIETLERLTGLDFAASDDATGNAEYGGDWLLETDDVDLLASYFDAERVEDFDETLSYVYDLFGDGSAIITIGTPDDGGSIVWKENADGTYSLAGLDFSYSTVGAVQPGTTTYSIQMTFNTDPAANINVYNDFVDRSSAVYILNSYSYYFTMTNRLGNTILYINGTTDNNVSIGSISLGSASYNAQTNTLVISVSMKVVDGVFTTNNAIPGLAATESLQFILSSLKFTLGKVTGPGSIAIASSPTPASQFTLERDYTPPVDQPDQETNDQDTNDPDTNDQETDDLGTFDQNVTDQAGEDANADQTNDSADSAQNSGGESADSGEAEANTVTAFDQDDDYYVDADQAVEVGMGAAHELSVSLHEVNEELFAFDGAEFVDGMIDDVRQSVTLMNSSLRYLTQEVIGLHSLLRYVDLAGSDSELLLWIRRVTDLTNDMAAKSVRALELLTAFLREYRSLPVERRDMFAQVRIIEMNAELAQYNQQLVSMLAAVRAFSARVRAARDGGETAPSPELLALIQEAEQKSALVLKEQGERQDALSREIRNAELAQPTSL